MAGKNRFTEGNRKKNRNQENPFANEHYIKNIN